MEIAIQDNLIHQLKAEIQNRKNMLLENYQMLNKNQTENSLLYDVYNEYKSYYDYIIKMNEDKKNMLENLNKYLDEIIIENQLTEEQIYANKLQQQQIIRQLNKVKDELNTIVGKVE